MTTPPAAPAQPNRIPAATAIVFRRSAGGGPPELLMAVRAKTLGFAPGAAVFPGGRVDPADHELATRLAQPGDDQADLAGRIAAIRETLEEAGLLLAVKQAVTPAEVAAARAMLLGDGALASVLNRFGWTLEPDRLLPFTRWLRPDGKAFDTRFYLADLGTGDVTLEVDGTEMSTLLWTTAAAALDGAAQGRLKLVFPTLCTLIRLSFHADFAAAAADARTHPPSLITSRVEDRGGEPWLTIPEGLGFPVTGFPLAQLQRG